MSLDVGALSTADHEQFVAQGHSQFLKGFRTSVGGLVASANIAFSSRSNEPIVIERPVWQRVRSQFDERFFVTGELAEGYVLSRPVQIHIWIEGDEFVADVPLLNVHAFGASRSEALDNLGQTIVEHLRRLDAAGDMLSPRLKQERYILHYVVERRGA